MKTSFGGALIIFLTVVALSILPAQANQTDTVENVDPANPSGNIPTSTFEQQSILVEDLAVEVQSDRGIITVMAKIKNVSRAMISGYVTIHLISGEGQPVLSYEEEINGGDAFAHGTSVEFEIMVRVGDIKNISSVSVDFTRT